MIKVNFVHDIDTFNFIFCLCWYYDLLVMVDLLHLCAYCVYCIVL